MIVAVFAMLTVDVPVDDVIDVTVVRDRDVLATDAVDVVYGVRTAVVGRIARQEIGRAKLVFVDVIAVRVVQVGVVHVIDVIAVPDREMPAIFAMHVVVAIMNVRLHRPSPTPTEPRKCHDSPKTTQAHPT